MLSSSATQVERNNYFVTIDRFIDLLELYFKIEYGQLSKELIEGYELFEPFKFKEEIARLKAEKLTKKGSLKRIPTTEETAPISGEIDLKEIEERFLSNFMKLMNKANFSPLSKKDFGTCD